MLFPSDWRTNKRGHITMRAEKLKKRTGLDLTVHGLRRSFITTGERLRLRREDINLLTGHIDNSVTGKHYSKLSIDDLRPTLQRIADEIERLLLARLRRLFLFGLRVRVGAGKSSSSGTKFELRGLGRRAESR